MRACARMQAHVYVECERYETCINCFCLSSACALPCSSTDSNNAFIWLVATIRSCRMTSRAPNNAAAGYPPLPHVQARPWPISKPTIPQGGREWASEKDSETHDFEGCEEHGGAETQTGTGWGWMTFSTTVSLPVELLLFLEFRDSEGHTGTSYLLG